MKPIVIRNTSRYPDNAVRWLVNYAARYVRSEMERMGNLELFDRFGFYVEFRNKMFASYSGLYHATLVNERGGYPIADDARLRKVLVKVGAQSRFPLLDWTDHRYKDMPVGSLNDWQECAVAITAHELSHVKYSGDKDGETNCDTIMHDAVDAFRRDREQFDAAMVMGERKATERQFALAAKKSPEAVAAKKLADAEAALARWTRKQKLATTKVKFYTRAVRRAGRRTVDLQIDRVLVASGKELTS